MASHLISPLAHPHPHPHIVLAIWRHRKLVNDEHVRFAGYQVRHPLEKDVYFKVQTDEHSYVLAARPQSACDS